MSSSAKGTPPSRWSTDDFPSLSWHDNHIHGWAIREGEHGEGDLVLDIDFILEWLSEPGSSRCRFRIAPATLTFHHATELVLSLDYARQAAAMAPASISEIRRQTHTYPNGYESFRWVIDVSWPAGRIEFLAEGFSQKLRAEPIVSAQQCLTPEQREALLA